MAFSYSLRAAEDSRTASLSEAGALRALSGSGAASLSCRIFLSRSSSERPSFRDRVCESIRPKLAFSHRASSSVHLRLFVKGASREAGGGPQGRWILVTSPRSVKDAENASPNVGRAVRPVTRVRVTPRAAETR